MFGACSHSNWLVTVVGGALIILLVAVSGLWSHSIRCLVTVVGGAINSYWVQYLVFGLVLFDG